MANIDITITANTIKFVTNDLADIIGIDESIWNINEMQYVRLMNRPQSHVDVFFKSSIKWIFSFDGVFGTQIDTVNGVAPTSNKDLFDKIAAVIG